jgi:hypothetical protein
MTIEQKIKFLEKQNLSKNQWKNVLDYSLNKIKFLESIYMSDGKWHCFSEEMNDIAHKERQELCQLTGYIYHKFRKEKND